MKKSEIKLVLPQTFTIKLSSCGLNTCNATFKKMENKSALKLALSVNSIMAEQFIGMGKKDKNIGSKFLYDVAVCILGGLEGVEKKQLQTDIIDYKKILTGWVFKEVDK